MKRIISNPINQS